MAEHPRDSQQVSWLHAGLTWAHSRGSPVRAGLCPDTGGALLHFVWPLTLQNTPAATAVMADVFPGENAVGGSKPEAPQMPWPLFCHILLVQAKSQGLPCPPVRVGPPARWRSARAS